MKQADQVLHNFYLNYLIHINNDEVALLDRLEIRSSDTYRSMFAF